MTQNKQAWGSRLGLILAMAGNAVGLGNFLRFPIQAVQNGGGAFIIPYIVSFILLGIPLVLMEWAIGKHGGIAGYHATPLAMQHLHKNPFWKYTGALAVFSSMVIASYYSYIESWTLSYALHSIFGTFNGMTETEISSFFNNYLDINHSTLGIPYEPIVLLDRKSVV